jgi:glycosyltransferase involved in cell wall biosynthesis
MLKSDIAVLTSEKEGIPRGLMEAMALGKPVIATDVPGTNELVVHGETGLLVPLNSFPFPVSGRGGRPDGQTVGGEGVCGEGIREQGGGSSMGPSLLSLACDAVLRRKLGEAGRRRVLERFDDGKIVEMWLKAYGNALFSVSRRMASGPGI